MSRGLYRVTSKAFPPEQLTAIEESVMSSPYLGPSPLGAEFVATRGFSVVFRRSALDAVCKKLPFVAGFLDRAIFAGSNAFYVNPLVMAAGSRVEAHIDCRLIAAENIRIIPTLVSVLYVRGADPAAGGALVFQPGTEEEVRLQPATGDLLHFRGNLLHAVSPVAGTRTRVSIVCEQYNLAPDSLAAFPELAILTADSLAPRIAPT